MIYAIRSASLLFVVLLIQCLAADELSDQQRRERVAQRRAQIQVIVHRGASTLARENTLRAYRVALELGADGNEIDIRATRDGVLVCFHDDMLDHHLEAFGDVADYDWEQLRKFKFRISARTVDEQHIPTLEDVLLLHRQHAALLHLDIKRPGLDEPIIKMLDRLDLWDHVVAVNADTAPAVASHSKFRPGQYKGSLYQDRAELNPEAISNLLAAPGDMVIVDDPRGVLIELGRTIGKLSPSKMLSGKEDARHDSPNTRSENELLEILNDADDWSRVPSSDAEVASKAADILARATAAEEARRRRISSPEMIEALERRVIQRGIHPEWMVHGLDGASALRALAEISPKKFAELARVCVWRIDPKLDQVADPRWSAPTSWVDFRTKAIIFPLIEQHRIHEAKALCREYLDLTDEAAREIGPLHFEAAARALLAVDPGKATAIELLKHRRQDVRGAAILMCLDSHSDNFATWGRAALEAEAPHALRYAVEQ